MPVTLPDIHHEIVATLGYFDYFQYPLSSEQIFAYLPVKLTYPELEAALLQLEQQEEIQSYQGFYGLCDIRSRVARRLDGETRFVQMQQRIQKTAGRLSRFPFIRFVGLSGSLSKGFAPQGADIDLFIVTVKNRLWICRTLLHLMKKMSFLKGSQHWYCMNYFIDVTALRIEEQNYFTAIELSSLKPLVDAGGWHEQLLAANHDWIMRFLPNLRAAAPATVLAVKPAWWAWLCTVSGSDRLNERLMRWTDAKWRAKWRRRHYPEQDYPLAFKTRINISKNHLHNYQKKLLAYMKDLSRRK